MLKLNYYFSKRTWIMIFPLKKIKSSLLILRMSYKWNYSIEPRCPTLPFSYAFNNKINPNFFCFLFLYVCWLKKEIVNNSFLDIINRSVYESILVGSGYSSMYSTCNNSVLTLIGIVVSGPQIRVLKIF